MSKPTLISRVRAGAALLDKVRRSRAWRGKIDLDRLDISQFGNGPDGPSCVLDQLYPGWDMPAAIIEGIWWECGFNGTDTAALTRAWKRYLRSEEGRP